MEDFPFPESFIRATTEFETQALASLSSAGLAGQISLYCFEELTSTMDAARIICETPGAVKDSPYAVCILSRSQTKGRGRQGRTWVSPSNAGIYVTFGFSPSSLANDEPSDFSALALAMGLAVADCVGQFGVRALLKWPNDVLLPKDGANSFAKLAGILLESSLSAQQKTRLRVGIGLNLTPAHDSQPPGISLTEAAGREIDYFAVFVTLSRFVLGNARVFFEHGFSPFLDQWNSSSIMSGRRAKVSISGASRSGTARGVDECGRLIVELDSAEEQPILVSAGVVELPDVTCT